MQATSLGLPLIGRAYFFCCFAIQSSSVRLINAAGTLFSGGSYAIRIPCAAYPRAACGGAGCLFEGCFSFVVFFVKPLDGRLKPVSRFVCYRRFGNDHLSRIDIQ
jgi:hypothetical protein